MLETEFLKLKYHANVESNTDEVDAEEYFNNNYKKIDANAKKNYEKLQLLVKQQSWNTIKGKSLHIQDSAEWEENSLSISGDMEQEKRSGKNFIPLSTNRTLNGVTLSVDEKGIYTLNGTATNVCFFTIPLKNVLPIGTSKTMSLKVLDGTASGNGAFYLAFRVRNSDNVYSNVPNMAEIQYLTSGKAYVTKTITNECASAEITVLSGVTLNNVKLTIQLEEGTTATEFEQYGTMPSTEFPSMPVVCTGVQKIRQFGKNLFDVNDKKSVNDLITVDANDWITATYNNSTGTNAKYMNYMTNKCNKIKANTNYVLFLEVKNVSGTGEIYLTSEIANEKMQFNNAIAVSFSNLNINKIYKHTITSKTDLTDTAIITMIRSFVKFNAGENGSITFRLSVLEDTNITVNNFVYEPYWEQIHTLDLGTIQLCAIKDTNGNVVAKDRHVFRNNKWQWEKNVGKKIINGTTNETERITLRTNTSTTHTKFILANSLPSKIKDALTLTCSHFITKNANDANISEDCISSNTVDDYKRYLYISVENKIATTVEELKTYLANNNLTVYYALATPVYEDCTAEQSTLLDKLYNNFELAKGTNNIIVESENGVGVNLELDYMQDLQAKLNILEAMCVSNASQEV